ncbi:hypothetical protein GGI09_001393 [Coemansia sp. S100]|nr:hypothetical protein LPJ71_001121 [Coemansia sp. S17]KAJ2102109.1 hypothetical protein GGI09_001393 [Coemansia sp. S100]KAJ2110208.1 hypothetical protein GGI16_000394 [Coemansia sp. S142-1]
MHFFILAALASIFGAHVLEPLNEQPRAALTGEIVFCAQDTTVASPLPTATGTYSHGYHDTATPDAMLGATVRGAHNRGLLFGATETSTPHLTYIGGMDLQAEPTGFGGILSQNGARSGPGRIHFHHRPSGPTPAHHTTVAIPTPIPTCPKAQEREQILMPETAAHTSPPARPIEPALLWGEQLLPPLMARDFIIGIACFMVGCVIATVVIRYGQGTVSDGPNDDDTDNDSPNDSGTDDDNGTDDDGNSDREVSNKHKIPVDDEDANEDANDRSDRPTEPALLWGEQLLPPPMSQYLAISIVSFMVGCVVTTVVIQYGQGTVGEATNNETVAGGNVVDAAHPAPTDDETVARDVIDTVHPARIDEETVAGGEAVDTVQTDRVDDDGTVAVIEVVDAAQSARTDQNTIVGGEAVDTAQTDRVDDETVDGDAVDAAHPARSDEETIARDTVDTAQLAHINDETIARDTVVDAAHPTRNDDETIDDSDAVEAVQADRVDNEAVAGIEVVDAAQSARSDQGTIAGGYVKIRNMAASAVQQAPVDDDGTVNDSADKQPSGSASEPGNSEPWKKCHRSKRGGVKVRARLERRLERLAATASQQPDEEPARYGQQSNEDQAPTTAFSSNDRRYNRTKKW